MDYFNSASLPGTMVKFASGDPLASIHSVNWRLVQRCNTKCIFCYHWQSSDAIKQEYHPSKIINLYEQFQDLGVKKVVLNGGEPLLHPFFSFAVRSGKRLGMEIIVNTNGILLSNDEMAKDAIDSGLDGAFISIHSAHHENHDLLKDRKGAWARTVTGIRTLRRYSSDVNILINVVLTHANYSEALDIARMAADLGANGVHFSQIDNLRGVDNSYLRLDALMQKKFYFEIFPSVIECCSVNMLTTKVSPLPRELLGNGIQKLGTDLLYSKQIVDVLRNPPVSVVEEIESYAKGEYGALFYSYHKCFVPTSTTYIMANGDVYPCVRSIGFEDSNDVIGNVYVNNLAEILRSEKYLNFASLAGKSNVCQSCKNLHGSNLYKDRKLH